MNGKFQPILDHLTLGNLSQKLKNMRDQLRIEGNNDFQLIHEKIQKNDEQSIQNTKLPAHIQDNAYIRNTQSVIEGFISRNDSRKSRAEDLIQPQSSQTYLNVDLAEDEFDFEEIKRLANKKISEPFWNQYILYRLKNDILEKIKEIFQESEEIDGKIQTKDFILKINKLGVHFSEAIAVQIPILKRKINLKKVLFELYFKSKIMAKRINWIQFKQTLEQYRFPTVPTIDDYMSSFVSKGQKSKNYFHLSTEIVNQLKEVYRRCSKEKFLSYCPLKQLLKKLNLSKLIGNNLDLVVRPKSHYLVQVTLRDTLIYISNYAPLFVDIDQFLLFFTVKGFTYYPIEQRWSSQQMHQICQVKSDRYLRQKQRKVHTRKGEYSLSTNNINSIRNKKLQQMIKQQENKKQEELKVHFKARPMPKSISKEKYQEFVNTFHHKIQQGRKVLDTLRSESQQEIQRLKHQTKLFLSPKRKQIQQRPYHITSRPPPSCIKQPLLKQIQNEKEERRNKIFSENKLKYEHQWRQLPLVATLDHSPKCRHERVKESYHLSVRDIPDYQTQQLKIQQQLRQKQSRNHPTQPQPFYFHTSARHPRHQHAQHFTQHEPIQHYDYKQIIYSPEPEIYYTQKMADLVVANKKRIIEKQKSINKNLQEEAERQKRHNNFAKYMKGNLRKIPDTGKICQNEAKIKIQRHKKYWKNLDHQHQSNLNQIYAKILKRPFLYQMQSPKNQKNQEIDINKKDIPKKIQKKKKKSQKIQIYRSL